jgi:hypothetical protein
MLLLLWIVVHQGGNASFVCLGSIDRRGRRRLAELQRPRPQLLSHSSGVR